MALARVSPGPDGGISLRCLRVVIATPIRVVVREEVRKRAPWSVHAAEDPELEGEGQDGNQQEEENEQEDVGGCLQGARVSGGWGMESRGWGVQW